MAADEIQQPSIGQRQSAGSWKSGACRQTVVEALYMLPQAAEAYRRQITQGCRRPARRAEARMLLKELFGGTSGWSGRSGGLVAHLNLHTPRCCVA